MEIETIIDEARRPRMFLMQFYGDLPVKAPTLCAQARIFSTMEEAHKWLNVHIEKDWDGDERNGLRPSSGKFWFDPEDDRIAIFELMAGAEHPVLRWHASGFHWPHDASDLPGGPMDQGCLFDDIMSLYDRATTE